MDDGKTREEKVTYERDRKSIRYNSKGLPEVEEYAEVKERNAYKKKIHVVICYDL